MLGPTGAEPPSPADAVGIEKPQPFDAREIIRKWKPFPDCGDIATNAYKALVELGEQATFEQQQLTI